MIFYVPILGLFSQHDHIFWPCLAYVVAGGLWFCWLVRWGKRDDLPANREHRTGSRSSPQWGDPY